MPFDPSTAEAVEQDTAPEQASDASAPAKGAFDPSTAQPVEGEELSNVPDLKSGSGGSITGENLPTNTPDTLNLGDHAALSFLQKPDDQQAYLKKKYPYVVPDGQGNYMVGKDMNSLTPVNPSSSGNTFMSWLASQSSQIAPMVGMTIGSAAGVPGAAAGAAAGEAISKDIGAALGSTESPQKMAVDTAISGAFGAAGQAAAKMFGLGVKKFIAPNLARAIDAKTAQMAGSGQDPSKFMNFMASAMHFASGVDKNDVQTLMRYGVSKTLADPEVNTVGAIDGIAGKIMNSTQKQRTNLGALVGAANQELLGKAGSRNVIDTNPLFEYLKGEINQKQLGSVSKDGVLTLFRDPYSPTDTKHLSSLLTDLGAQPIRTSFQQDAFKGSTLLRQASDFAKQVGYKIDNPAHQGSIEKMMQLKPGSIQGELEKFAEGKQELNMGNAFRAFKLPTQQNISVGQGIRVRQIASALTDADKSPLSDSMRRIFTNVLYNDQNGGISSQLTKVASANGVDNYVASNMAYRNFMKSVEDVKAQGLNPYDERSIQNYSSKINDRPPIDQKVLQNFEKNVGAPVFDNLKKYSAIQSIQNHEPNFLRLGAIAGLLGSVGNHDDLSKTIVRTGEFAALAGVVSPFAKTASLRLLENGNAAASAALKGLVANSMRNRGTTAVASQGLLKGLLNSKTDQTPNQ